MWAHLFRPGLSTDLSVSEQWGTVKTPNRPLNWRPTFWKRSMDASDTAPASPAATTTVFVLPVAH